MQDRLPAPSRPGPGRSVRRAEWWTPLGGQPVDSRLTLLMLPFAGGAAHTFMPWVPHLAGLRILAAQYPGRGVRIAEPPAATAPELIVPLTATALDRVDGPVALVGHSMGALLGFEVAWRLEQAGVPVAAFIASASRAPQARSQEPVLMHALPDAELVAELHRRGDLPAAVIADRGLLDCVLPALRADFRIAEEYTYEPAGRRLSCPLFAFGGIEDDLAPASSLGAWRVVTDGAFRATTFPGSHFYYREQLAEVCGAVTAALGIGRVGDPR